MHTTSRKQLLTLANAAADQRHKDIVDYKAECQELRREVARLREANGRYQITICELRRALGYAE